MDIRKFRHACLVLEKDGQSLAIDPGEWTTDFVMPTNVVGVVITHEHADHFYPERLQQIVAANPGVTIVAHADVVAKAPNLKIVPVVANETKQIGNFKLAFVGGEHARVFPDKPVCANLGVIVDSGELYYPGDSLVTPHVAVKTLALPVVAPWLKLSEALDFLIAMQPQEVISTHDALLSDEGRATIGSWITRTAVSIGATVR